MSDNLWSLQVFDLTSYAPSHLTVTQVVPTKSVMQFGGIDASSLFPVQVRTTVLAPERFHANTCMSGLRAM